jgi:hypothetical protein
MTSWSRPPRRALTPDAGHARHGAEPRRLLPGARSANPYYIATPGIVQKTMDKFAA